MFPVLSFSVTAHIWAISFRKHLGGEYKPTVNSTYHILNPSHAVQLLLWEGKEKYKEQEHSPVFPNVALCTRSNRLVLELPGKSLGLFT